MQVKVNTEGTMAGFILVVSWESLKCFGHQTQANHWGLCTNKPYKEWDSECDEPLAQGTNPMRKAKPNGKTKQNRLAHQIRIAAGGRFQPTGEG